MSFESKASDAGRRILRHHGGRGHRGAGLAHRYAGLDDTHCGGLGHGRRRGPGTAMTRNFRLLSTP